MKKVLKKAERGFTLIELMIVVAIIGILAAVAIPMFLDSIKTSKKSEALVQLNKIASKAKIEANVNGAFPTLTEALTPSSDCCTLGAANKKKCPATPANWTTANWRALDFSVDEDHYFQYGYNGAAAAFTATAHGDMDCDGVYIDYTAVGTKDATGIVNVKYNEPPPNTD